MRFVNQFVSTSPDGMIHIRTSMFNASTLCAFILTNEFRNIQEKEYNSPVSFNIFDSLLLSSNAPKTEQPIDFIIPSYIDDLKHGDSFNENDIAPDKIITYLLTKKYSEKTTLLISSCVCAETAYNGTKDIKLDNPFAQATTLNGFTAVDLYLIPSEAEFLARSIRAIIKDKPSKDIYPGEHTSLDAMQASPDEDEIFFDSDNEHSDAKKKTVMYNYDEIESLLDQIEEHFRKQSSYQSYLDKNTVLKKDVQ